MENKKSKNKHYIPTYELVFYRHENYKTFLTEKKKEAKIRQQALTLKLKKNKERLKKDGQESITIEIRRLFRQRHVKDIERKKKWK